MPNIKTTTLAPGIGVRYDEDQNPIYAANVLEAIGLIKKFPTGALLLDRIDKSTPATQPGSADESWASTYKVLIIPTAEIKYYKDWKGFSIIQKCEKTTLSGLSGPSARSLDQNAASVAGQGTQCEIRYNNTVCFTGHDEVSPPFIVLAHELIHALHGLYGSKKNGEDEEPFTVGLAAFAAEAITENKIRKEAGLPERQRYF